MNHQIFTLFLLINLCYLNASQSLTSLINSKCDHQHTIDISNGTFNKTTKNIIHNNNVYTPAKYFLHENKFIGCNCDVTTCISRCCLDEECDYKSFLKIRINLHHENLTLSKENAPHESVYLESDCIKIELEEEFFLLENGALYSSEMDEYYNLDSYCVSNEGNDTHDKIVALVCYDEGSVELSSEVNKFGILVSIPFLFVTLLIYCFLPDKKIQIKCLMAYITCLLLSYLFLVYLQFNPNLKAPDCQIIAACGVYFFMSTFCWMNITCIDMYLTFSGKRALLQTRSSKWKRFGFYSIFAYGAPVILLSIIFGVNLLDEFNGHPKFGIDTCWIGEGLPQLLYFYGPMAILLAINTVLFTNTAHTIRVTIRDNQKTLRSKESQRHCESNKQDYLLYIKLFIAMGINWSLELISFIFEWTLPDKVPSWIWFPTDFCNAAYGLFIFIIFVCKRTVWIKLLQRFYVLTGRPMKARSLSTRTSAYQMSQTERTHVDENATVN